MNLDEHDNFISSITASHYLSLLLFLIVCTLEIDKNYKDYFKYITTWFAIPEFLNFKDKFSIYCIHFILKSIYIYEFIYYRKR